MRYPLFISDFDGTLVRKDRTVSEGNKAAIRQYIDRGGTFAICTGRTLTSIMPRLADMGITDGLVVAFQGAVIADIRTGKLLKNDVYDREKLLIAMREIERRGLHYHIYTSEDFYSNRRDVFLSYYENICKIQAIVEGDLIGMVERENTPTVKILIMIEDEKKRALKDELHLVLGDDYFVSTSGECLVEIMPKGVNKGSAVKFLSDYFGVPKEGTAAIGDQLNDLPMIEAAGGKFVVANAEKELKELARTVVASNEEDGVAEALKIAQEEGV